MEFLTIFLSSLITLVSPAGIVVDQVAENAIRNQFAAVEQLRVRVDNAPSYQIVQGKAERVRIAGRGVFPLEGVRLEALELETDPIQINPRSLRQGKAKLEKPLRAGVRLVVKEADVNQALRSPTVLNRLQKLGVSVLGTQLGQQVQKYTLVNPQVAFLTDQRVRFQVGLQESNDPTRLDIMIESGVKIDAGRRVQLVNPIVQVDGAALPDEFVAAIATGISNRADLAQLESSGITARVLQLNLEPGQLELATFVQFIQK